MTATNSDDDQSAAELTKQLSQQTATLVRKELELARVELQEKAKRMGIGGGLFGGAGVIGLYAGGTLVAAVVLVIATALEPWISALIVGVALVGLAGILALLGKTQVKKAVPPMPQSAIDTTKADIDTVRRSAKRS